mgnify:CR=1 FL=1
MDNTFVEIKKSYACLIEEAGCVVRTVDLIFRNNEPFIRAHEVARHNGISFVSTYDIASFENIYKTNIANTEIGRDIVFIKASLE